jgi:WD40 repeat protein
VKFSIWKLSDWLQQAAGNELPVVASVLRGHQEDVVSLVFKAEGQQLLSASLDQTARLWNFSQRGPEDVVPAVAFTGHSGPIWQVAISPDGKQVATAGDDRTVALWDAETGKRLNRFRGHQGPVYAVAYAQATSGDGYRVVSAGADRRVLLWNTNEVRAVDYQAIGQRLTNQLDGQTPANPDRTAIKTPDYRLLGSHAGDVRSATFMRDDGFVVTSGHDNTVRVWNLADEGNSSAGAYRVLRGHGGWVRACSALGNATIISGGYDSTLKTWDYESYRERIDLLGHDDAISFATFSRDGTKVVTAARDRKAIVWDVATGQPLATLDEGHEFLTSSARFFGPGDDRLLTSAGDGTTIVWSLSTGAQVARYPGTGSNAVAALAPDKQWIATGSSTNEVLIWDVTQPSDNPQPQRLTGHAAMVTCAAFTVLDADLLLFTGDATGAGILWKRNAALETWQQDKFIAGHHNGFTIAAAQFTPDGKRLLTAGADHQVKQWDTATGRELPDSALEHADAVRLLELTPDGRSAVTVTAVDEKTQLLQAWNLATRAVKSLRLDDAVQGLSISPDGQFVAIGDTNPENTVWRWNLATGELTRFWPRGRLSATVWGLAWSPQGQQLLTVGGNHAHLWDVASGERVQTFSPHGPLVAADISTDGTLVVTAGQDGTAKVWHIDERRVVAKIAGGHLGGDGRPVALRGASFVANLAGRDYVLTTGEDNKACLWSLTEQVPERIKTFADDQHSIVQAVASPDGLRLLTGSDDGVAQMWDIATGERLRTLRDPDAHTLGLRCLSFSNDGRHAITGGDDNLAIVWNVSSGERLQKLQGHTAGITGVGFSPDGRRAITSSNDGTAKLWDVATGVEILTLSGHQSEVTAASFSPDGRLVLTAGRDRSALLWPAATLPPALAFTDQQLLYRERGIAQAIDEGASFSDPSAASFGGARLTIALRSEPINGLREEFSLSLAEPEEEMLRLEGNQILMAVGTAERAVPIAEWRSESSGRQAEIKFLPAANHHCVQTVLNRLRYTATWDSLDAPAARTLELVYVSATGESSPTLRMPIEFETTAASTTVAQLPAR